MRRLLRGTLTLVALLSAAAAAYALFALWLWRDLPVETLEARYGDAALRRVEVDGVPLRYRLEGPAGAPVVVLIHSHYLDMRMWDGWMAPLASTYRVLRYDLSGHGLTGPDPAGTYTVARDVALLEGLLAALGIERVMLVGSSLGGNVAFTYAARHADRVDALVLINSGGLRRADSRSGRELPGWADAVLPLVPPVALHAFLGWMIADDRVIDATLQQRFVDLWRRAGNRPAELARLRQYDTGDPDPLLAAITAPTLLLWGEDNPQLPVALAAEFERRLTRAARVERRTYSAAGHVLPVERPAESVTDTLRFLSGAVANAPVAAP